jgi:hypothetical protein
MELLEPDWNQPRPELNEVLIMCRRIELRDIETRSDAVTQVLQRLRESHCNGGAMFGTVSIGADRVFDWYASRNRLLEWEILPRILRREETKAIFKELNIGPLSNTSEEGEACSTSSTDGFRMDNAFLFDGQLAACLHAGGAYTHCSGDGRAAKQLALNFCDALFQHRFAELSLFTSHAGWTPWFYGIAWDWTAVVFDRRKRLLHILAVTDTD